MNTLSSGLTIRGVTQLVISTQLKACISDGTGVHLCLCNWQPMYLGRHHQCWNVYRGFRATQHRCIRQEWGSIPLAEVQLQQTFAEKVVVHSGKRETVQTFLRLGYNKIKKALVFFMVNFLSVNIWYVFFVALWIKRNLKFENSVSIYILYSIPTFLKLNLDFKSWKKKVNWLRCTGPTLTLHLCGVWVVFSRFRKLMLSVHKGEEKQSHIIWAPIGCMWSHSWPIAAFY